MRTGELAVASRYAQPLEHNFALKREEWELVVFDAAVMFTAITVKGRGGRTRDEFASFSDAIAHVGDRRACVYAVTATGRSIVLDRVDWPRWLTRSALNKIEQENPTTTSTVKPENTAMTDTQITEQASVFLISWGPKGPRDCTVGRFPTQTAATAYAYEVLPADATANVIETALDFSDRNIFSGSVLVEIFNKIANGAGSVRRFESLAYARERVFSEIVQRFGDVPYTTTPATTVPTAAPASAPKEKTPVTKTKTTTTSTRGRKPNVSEDAKITVLAAKNPKREGTEAYTRFAFYSSGIKVSTFLTRGGRRVDLTYDAGKEYIRIDEPATTHVAA